MMFTEVYIFLVKAVQHRLGIGVSRHGCLIKISIESISSDQNNSKAMKISRVITLKLIQLEKFKTEFLIFEFFEI